MKRILITGANSFIGMSVENWLLKSRDEYKIDTIDVKDPSWRDRDFSIYDIVFHVAGIAHISKNPKLKDLYYKVNRDLAIDVAKKAKDEGVSQFIFMSSIMVYGDEEDVISIDTATKPKDFYADSKLQAEEGLKDLKSYDFKLVIVRAPMVYGKDSKGNYRRLSSFAKKLPFFPRVDNRRSMLHIDNLSEFIRLMIYNEEDGIFHPQNKEYVNTSLMVKEIAKVNNKKIWLVKGLNRVFKILTKRVDFINKVFGDLVYDRSLSHYKEDYNVRDFKDSIRLTEK